MLHAQLTEKIIKAYYNVYNNMGYGFLESVYENAMIIELRKMGIQVANQEKIVVYYDKQVVGRFKADLIVEKKVILELKVVSKLIDMHEIQLINYLKATDYELGMLLNFGTKPEFKRRILSNNYNS